MDQKQQKPLSGENFGRRVCQPRSALEITAYYTSEAELVTRVKRVQVIRVRALMLLSDHGLHGRCDKDNNGGNLGGPCKVVPVTTVH